MKDLSQRLLPALVAASVVILLAQWQLGMAIVIAICALGCFFELYKLTTPVYPSFYLVFQMILGATALYFLYSLIHLNYPNTLNNIAWTPIHPWGAWLYAIGLILMFSKSWMRGSLPIITVFYPLIGCLALVQLTLLSGTYDYDFLLLLLVNVWATDAFAYFGGSLIKGPKLAPTISPGKTISGWLSALLGILLVSALANIYYLDWTIKELIWWSLIIWLSSTLGDLFESQLKRISGVKDSGKFLPGHGGFLDRLDSVIYAAPFALYIFKNI